MENPLRVLMVEDTEDDVLLVIRLLQKGGYEPVYERVETAVAMDEALGRETWDIIISDYSMPHFSGIAAFTLYKEKGLDIPFILVSGAIGEELAVAAMVAGIHDYVMKNNLTRLVPAIQRELREAESRRERKRAEDAIRETQDLLNEVGEIARIGGWKMDLINRKATWTQGTHDIVEIAPRAPIPGPDEHVDYYLPEYRPLVVEAMRALIEDDKPLDFEAQLRTAKGNVKWCRAQGRVVREGGKAIEVYGTFQDITERRQAEEEIRKYSAELTEKNEELRAMTQQLWQSAKLATMGELSASIAHELNNPLATVSLRVESLLEKTPQDNPNHREMEIIGQEVKRMATLIANLLQFCRRGQQQISTVDICEEIEKTLELIYYHLRKYNIVILREFPKEAPRIHADRQQLLQLFLNLFTNASDAMPQGGTLTMRVTVPTESKQVIIEIADTGTGIPPEILPKVAEPFFSTKPEGKGTGLGLAICRRIVKEHKGTFDLLSEGIPGRGTTARIALPVTNGTNSAGLKDQLPR